MKQTEMEERNLLPDSVTLAEEKTRETMLAGVETFSHESLSHVKTPEPVTGAELLKQEMNIKSIVDSVVTFDSASLRAATTEEKVVPVVQQMLLPVGLEEGQQICRRHGWTIMATARSKAFSCCRMRRR